MPENSRPEYSQRLRALMEENHLSAYSLASKIGRAEQGITKWLTEGRVPHRPTLDRICALFEVRPEWLVEGKGPKHAPAAKSADLPADLRTDLIALADAAQRHPEFRRTLAHLAHFVAKS